MQAYEYKVVPAPRRGEKARGAKTVADRFAVALTQVMNEQGRDGWDYLRADTLPCEERVGLTGTATHFQHMLVFRRAVAQPVAASAAAPAPVVVPVAPTSGLTDDEVTRILATPLAADHAVPPVGPAIHRPNGRP